MNSAASKLISTTYSIDIGFKFCEFRRPWTILFQPAVGGLQILLGLHPAIELRTKLSDTFEAVIVHGDSGGFPRHRDNPWRARLAAELVFSLRAGIDDDQHQSLNGALLDFLVDKPVVVGIEKGAYADIVGQPAIHQMHVSVLLIQIKVQVLGGIVAPSKPVFGLLRPLIPPGRFVSRCQRVVFQA